MRNAPILLKFVVSNTLKDIIGHCCSTSLYYVLEYLDCDLHRYIYDVGDVHDIKVSVVPSVHCCESNLYCRPNVSDYALLLVQNVLCQILKGINHMHSKLVMHRDLKPQNILVNKATSVVKLADFGLSRDY
jgi:serine/threonine protein kinase